MRELRRFLLVPMDVRSLLSLICFSLGCVVSFLTRRRSSKFRFLPTDLLVRTVDGIFYCRKGTGDFCIVAPFHERKLRKYFESVARGVFVDVGAHVGKYTVMVGRRLKGKGKVIAVEAEPRNFEALKRNVALNSLEDVVVPLNLAVSQKRGKVWLYLPDEYDTAGPSLKKKGRHQNRVAVRASTLERILERYGIKEVELLKVDVEGAELEAMRSLGKFLRRVKRIVYEENDDEVSSFLGENGFQVMRTPCEGYKVAVNRKVITSGRA